MMKQIQQHTDKYKMQQPSWGSKVAAKGTRFKLNIVIWAWQKTKTHTHTHTHNKGEMEEFE